jgi:hypothetical protein
VAVWQTADDGEGIALGGDDGAALQYTAQALDMSGGPVGKVAHCALTNLAALAVALAQENGRG